MNAELKAQPQEIVSKAQEMKSIRGQLTGLMEAVKTEISGLNTTWQSEAASTYQAKFGQVHDDIEMMLNIVDEYSGDLMEIAQIYQKAESEVESTSSTLPGDVFGV